MRYEAPWNTKKLSFTKMDDKKHHKIVESETGNVWNFLYDTSTNLTRSGHYIKIVHIS